MRRDKRKKSDAKSYREFGNDTAENKKSESVFDHRLTRRQALSTGAKAAVGVGVAAVAAAAGYAAYTTLSPGASSSSKPIKIGNVLDNTGGLAIYGTPMWNATLLTISEINNAGGVLGRPLQLVQYDAQSDIKLYTQYAQKLILDDKVDLLIGSITSASREAMRAVVDQNQGPVFIHNEQWEGGVCDKWLFGMGTTPSQQLKPLIDFAVPKLGKNWYTIGADYGYGHITAGWSKVFVEKDGGKIVGEEFIPLDQTDYSTTISNIQNAKPDVVNAITVGAAMDDFYPQYLAAGLKDKIPLVSNTFGVGADQFVVSPDAAKGMYVIYGYFQELNNPENQAFVQKYKGAAPSIQYVTDASNLIWTCLHMYKKAAEMAGSTNRDAIISAFETGKIDFQAPEGHVQMDGTSHCAIHTTHLAQVNANHGFDILQDFPNVPPLDTSAVCNLIQNPNTHTQYGPNYNI